MHAGLNRPDRTLSPGGVEVAQVAREFESADRFPRHAAGARRTCLRLRGLVDHGHPTARPRLLVCRTYAFRWYEGLRRLGLDIDIVPPGQPLQGYRAVVVPSLPHFSEAALAAFQATEAPILFGPRSGSKTRHFAYPGGTPAGPAASAPALKVIQVASLRPGLSAPVRGKVQGSAERWREWVETALEPVARFSDGSPSLVEYRNRFYLAAWPAADLLRSTCAACARRSARGSPCQIFPSISGCVGVVTFSLRSTMGPRRGATQLVGSQMAQRSLHTTGFHPAEAKSRTYFTGVVLARFAAVHF